jgi:hypothetical protein
MRPTRDGDLLIHQSSTNRIMLVTLKASRRDAVGDVVSSGRVWLRRAPWTVSPIEDPRHVPRLSPWLSQRRGGVMISLIRPEHRPAPLIVGMGHG